MCLSTVRLLGGSREVWQTRSPGAGTRVTPSRNMCGPACASCPPRGREAVPAPSPPGRRSLTVSVTGKCRQPRAFTRILLLLLLKERGEEENLDGIENLKDLKQERNKNRVYKISCLHNLKFSGLGHEFLAFPPLLSCEQIYN